MGCDKPLQWYSSTFYGIVAAHAYFTCKLTFVRVRENKNNIMKSLITILIASVLLFSCNKEVEPEPTPPTTSVVDIVEFDYDGTHYITTDLISSVFVTSSTTYSLVGIEQNGTNSYDDMSLSTTINTPAVGTFQLGTGGIAVNDVTLTLPSTSSSIPQVVLFAQFSSNPGTFTILAIDEVNKRINGTFSTMLTDTPGGVEHEITNGVFNVSYYE